VSRIDHRTGAKCDDLAEKWAVNSRSSEATEAFIMVLEPVS
jgi:hypothetical protein